MSEQRVTHRIEPEPGPDDVATVLGRGVEVGIISADQARRLMLNVAAPAGDARIGQEGLRQPVLVEALGYVGGAVVVAGCLLIASQVWSDLTTVWRLVVLGLAACGLLAGGWAAPRNGVGERLRAVLFLAATVASAGFLGVLADEALDLAADDVALFTSAGTAAVAGGLWWRNRRMLQQIAMMASLAVLAGMVVDRLPAPTEASGLGVLGIGLVWAVLGWGGRLEPGRIALVLGSATAILGAMITAEADAGVWLTLAVIVLVLAWAVVVGDLLLLGVASVGALLNLPRAIGRWFPDSASAGLAVVTVGTALLVLAVVISRRGSRRDGGAGPRTTPVPAWAVGTPHRSLVAALAVASSVVLVVLVLSLR